MLAWRHRLVLATTLLVAGMPAASPAQSVLLGVVRQDSTQTPLAGVDILIEGTNVRTTSDGSGRYRLHPIPTGSRTVLFRLVGHQPFREGIVLGSNDSVALDVVLKRQAVQVLDSVEVTGRVTRGVGIGREAFEERRARGFGFFIDSTELLRSEHRRVSDVLWGIQGIRIIREGGMMFASNGRGSTSMIRGAAANRDEYCFLSVFLDGRSLYLAGDPRVKRVDLARDIMVSELEAIEVYRSASEVPGAYSGASAACGVILLWSKRGR